MKSLTVMTIEEKGNIKNISVFWEKSIDGCDPAIIQEKVLEESFYCMKTGQNTGHVHDENGNEIGWFNNVEI